MAERTNAAEAMNAAEPAAPEPANVAERTNAAERIGKAEPAAPEPANVAERTNEAEAMNTAEPTPPEPADRAERIGAAEPTNPAEHTDTALVGFTAAAGAEIDRLFRAAMGAAGRFGGPRLRSRYGPGAGELLIDFRTVLAAPDGFVTATGVAEVLRYSEQVEIEALVRRAIDRGLIDRDDRSVIRATPAGHRFLDDLYAIQAEALGPMWAGASDVVDRLAAVADDLVAAASLHPVLPAGAFAAMTPNYEPGGVPAPVLLLNRLSAMRYHRSDAHAVAWRAAGLTAPQMVAIQAAGGLRRDAIERRTNEIATPPFGIIDTARQHAFLDDLRLLPVPD